MVPRASYSLIGNCRELVLKFMLLTHIILALTAVVFLRTDVLVTGNWPVYCNFAARIPF